MMKRLAIALAFGAALCGVAHGQAQFKDNSNQAINHPGYVVMCLNAAGLAIPMVNASDCSGGSAGPAARNFPGCTVGATSGTCLAASTALTFLQIQNSSATATIACRFGGAAVLNAKESVQLGPLQAASWGPNTAGVPNGAMNCIASAGSTPLYVEWN